MQVNSCYFIITMNQSSYTAKTLLLTAEIVVTEWFVIWTCFTGVRSSLIRPCGSSVDISTAVQRGSTTYIILLLLLCINYMYSNHVHHAC